MIGLGIFFVVFGIYASARYAGEYEKTMKELKKVAIPTFTCPKCGRQLPEGEYAFCPFCGSPIAHAIKA
jgi:ribosomal protein L37AE/L43A